MQERANQPKQKIEYNFDVTKHIRLVPSFQEKEVDKYFLHFEKVAENLNWPKEHSKYCKTCHTCQMVGKPNQTIPKAQLQPIPAFDEPFSRLCWSFTSNQVRK